MAEVKKPAVPSAGKGVEELEFSNTAGGKVKWYNRFEKQIGRASCRERV